MIRDFSNAKKEELYRNLDVIDNKEWRPFMIWCGGRAGEFGVWADKLGISSYTKQIDNYQNRVLNTNDSTRNQIDVIFENVTETDRRYAEIFCGHAETVKEQMARVQVMTEVMGSACGIGLDNGVMLFEMEQDFVYQREKMISSGREILMRRLKGEEDIDAAECDKICDIIMEKQPNMLINLYITDCYSSADSELVEKAIMNYYEKYRGEPDTPLYNHTKEMIANITTTNSDMDAEIQKFADAYERNIDRYIELSKLTSVPPEVLAVIHYRENTSDYLNGDFQVYLHNGERLGEVTVREPKGILYDDFDTAAIDAIAGKSDYIEKYHLYSNSEDIIAMMCFLEVYNGLGYYNNNHVSPYSYSGTNLYVSGKYVEDLNADGEMISAYHSEIVDQQVGSYLLLKAIMEE